MGSEGHVIGVGLLVVALAGLLVALAVAALVAYVLTRRRPADGAEGGADDERKPSALVLTLALGGGAFLLLALCGVGLALFGAFPVGFAPPPRPPVERSAFLSGLDWDGMIDRAVAARGRRPEWRGRGGGSGGSGGGAVAATYNSTFHGAFLYRGEAGKEPARRPEDLDRVLRALRGELEAALGRAGARVVSRDETAEKGLLRGFRLGYEVGPATGTVSAEGHADPADPRLTRLSAEAKETVAP